MNPLALAQNPADKSVGMPLSIILTKSTLIQVVRFLKSKRTFHVIFRILPSNMFETIEGFLYFKF